MSTLFDKALQEVPKEIKSFVDNSFDIVDQIHEILVKQGKTQRDLADILDKKESEISKWMRGTHNFTIKSISNIENALGEKIITTPNKTKSSLVTKFIPVKVHSSISTKENVWQQPANGSFFNDGLKSA